MSNILGNIEGALYGHFALLGYQHVSYPNGPLVNPSNTQTFYTLACKFGKPTPAAVGAGAKNRYNGFLQVNIHCPADNNGANLAISKAQAVVAHFKRGTVCTFESTHVRCSVPYYNELPVGTQARTWYGYVVTVPWIADIDND